MSLSKSEAQVIRNAVERLKGERGASPEVRALLADPRLRPYLDTWIVGPLAILIAEDRDRSDLSLAVSMSK